MSSKKFCKYLFKKSAKDRNEVNKFETKKIDRKTSCSNDKRFCSSTKPNINESIDGLNEYSKTKRTTDEKEMSKWNKFCKRMKGFRKLFLIKAVINFRINFAFLKNVIVLRLRNIRF
jgi:hypothetical protein